MRIMFFSLLIGMFAIIKVSYAQTKQFIYYLDENLASTSKENALIIGKGFQDEDNFRLDCFLSSSNELLLIAFFTDSSLNVFNGGYALYHGKNRIKEEGIYKHNKKDGVWKTYDITGKIVDSIEFENDTRIKFAKFNYDYKTNIENGKIKTDSSKCSIYYTFTDSLKNEFTTIYSTIKNGSKRIEQEIFFVGNKGVMKRYDSLQNVTTDSLFSREKKDAEYYGGDIGWRKFLQNNLRPEIGINNGAPAGTYKIVVKFIVKTDGTLSDINLENDPGYGMGKEALRVIKLTKKWKPASQYGRLVNAYRRQPITFQISEESGIRRRLF